MELMVVWGGFFREKSFRVPNNGERWEPGMLSMALLAQQQFSCAAWKAVAVSHPEGLQQSMCYPSLLKCLSRRLSLCLVLPLEVLWSSSFQHPLGTGIPKEDNKRSQAQASQHNLGVHK